MDIFCKIVNKEAPSTVLREGREFLAILDIEPHTEGHTLIIPKKHTRNLSEISKEATVEIFSYLQERERELWDMGYKGICVRINMGSAQEIPHLHIHVWGENKA